MSAPRQYSNLNSFDWHGLTGLPPVSSGLPAASPHLAGKSVLVTGAGGSIGSALATAILSCSPSRLLLLDTSESGLYEIDRNLQQTENETELISILGSVCNQNLLSSLFMQNQPQIVFHAAAFKQVPLLERNPFAAISNNALGTFLLAKTAELHGSESFVLVSTDKAVDPISLMGASKRIAELVLLALQTSSTAMRAVRLGNVLGSQGSVGPLFLKQIAQGGPVTVTHSEARRFFITSEHAVQALLSALSPEWTETILVPALGAQTRVVDLARYLITACSDPVTPTPISFTELRPGDKMQEVLISRRETWRHNAYEDATASGLRQIRSPAPLLRDLEVEMEELRESVDRRELGRMMETVLRLVPEYKPSSILFAEVERCALVMKSGRA